MNRQCTKIIITYCLPIQINKKINLLNNILKITFKHVLLHSTTVDKQKTIIMSILINKQNNDKVKCKKYCSLKLGIIPLSFLPTSGLFLWMLHFSTHGCTCLLAGVLVYSRVYLSTHGCTCLLAGVLVYSRVYLSVNWCTYLHINMILLT